jgi:hypothetical protein
MDIRSSSKRPKKSGVKRPISEEPAFKRLVEILEQQDPKRTEQLMEELENAAEQDNTNERQQ